jgi:hypothetical protein
VAPDTPESRVTGAIPIHLTAPAVMPQTIWRWKIRMRPTIGTATDTAPAMPFISRVMDRLRPMEVPSAAVMAAVSPSTSRGGDDDVVAGQEEREEPGGDDPGPHDGHDHLRERAPARAGTDDGSVVELLRHRWDEGPQHPAGEGLGNRHEHDDRRLVARPDGELEEGWVVGRQQNDMRHRPDDERRHEVPEARGSSASGGHVAREAADGERDGHRRRGDDRGVDGVAPEAVLHPDMADVVERHRREDARGRPPAGAAR